MRLKTDVQLIGTSAVIRDLREELARVARCDAKVLITGESGTGKEVVARIIGAHSLRASAPFVPVNCAGLPENLLESELFGHVKGSFTGAYRDKPGKLEIARNGTIFLDEIGEMTPRMQGLLLRFLETGEIQKVGAEQVAMASNVRVIAATNRNLRDLITQGQFREDLFFRLNVIHIVVPPLRERREDIPLLVEFFLH
ncbi:MAG TPA: sigma-54 factor interaction domain-containing protein, partial [Vicinamibacterales bacterium]|nr:sigma-54 factor interaction domain-containing protein [Vicinamibacterales bacterium]